MSEQVLIRGVLPRDLANATADAINAAMKRGMEVDEAVCVVLGAACDYGRLQYGDVYLREMALVVTEQSKRPIAGKDAGRSAAIKETGNA